MARLAFCDYHNMITILEKYEHNVDFHPIVDFVEASHIRNLKLNDEAGISSFSDAELFENLALIGYNILPNQKFTFQKGQFSHQWKYLIHTIMQCLSPKSTGFNEFSSNIATVVGEGSGTPTKPHHTPSPEAQPSSPTAPSSPSLPPSTTETSSALPTAANEPASPLRDDSQGEACPTISGLEARQDRANILKSSTLPHDSPTRVTSLAADEGTQDLEIASLKARIKMLEDKDGGVAEPSREDDTIKGRSLETGEEAAVKKSTERGSNDTKELVNVLTSLDAASILTSGVQVVSVPPATEVASCGYTLIKTKREDQRMDEQIARDAEIARIHAEEELQMLIDSLDRNNETIAKYLQEYKQFAEDLSIGERIELINDLVKYQDNYAKVLKYQSQQRKPFSKKQQREFYMSVLKCHSGWKTKHFKGMSLEEIREKFILVWKQIEDFVPMGSKEEGERVKRKGLRLEQESAKKVKTSEEVSEEDLKEMIQLVPVEEVYVEALQVKHPIIDWEIYTEGQRNYWKIISDEFLLPDYFPTACEDRFPLLSERDAPAEEVCTADEVKNDVFSQNPTSNIEDAFSLNFLDFIPASPDYVPTSPGKTYSNSSNSFVVVPITSPSLSLFHNDPYMKVLQAFYAKESHIPPPNVITPPVILTPSPVSPPSPLFDP
nr:hypothetical protein [Tanacetum cinerariifolium]